MRKLSLILTAAVLCLAACSSTPGTSSSPSNSAPGAEPTLSGDLTVFAAASLTNVFTDIGNQFQTDNPGVTVHFQFDASSTLASQINEGADADVFASADQANMTKITDTGKASNPTVFATNNLVLAVPSDNPAKVTSINDLANPDVKTVVCAPEVPCGTIAGNVLSAAGVTVTPVSQEQNVSAVATKLSMGEADAGFVYSTDVAASGGKLISISLPSSVLSTTKTPYPIVAVGSGSVLADAFVAYVLGDKGQAALAQAGFGSPA